MSSKADVLIVVANAKELNAILAVAFGRGV